MSAKRTLVIAPDGAIKCSGEFSYELNLGSTAPDIIVAELSLLAFDLADSITFRHQSGRLKVKVAQREAQGRATADCLPDLLTLTLSAEELGYWLSFFLRYYRNGVADVDHIDVEATPTAKTDRVVDLFVRVARAAPPLSPEEVRRRLGVPDDDGDDPDRR